MLTYSIIFATFIKIIWYVLNFLNFLNVTTFILNFFQRTKMRQPTEQRQLLENNKYYVIFRYQIAFIMTYQQHT